jgi:predicted CopG family antitoxin
MMFLIYHLDMRTTLTLDNDVAAKLKEEMKRSGKSFKDTVNRVLRNGLNIPKKRKVEPFIVNPKGFMPRITIDYDNIGELLEQIEGPLHR